MFNFSKSILGRTTLYFLLTILISFFILVFSNISTVNNEISYRKKVLEQKTKNELKDQVNIIYFLLESYFKRGDNLDDALEILRNIRVRNNDYFFVYNLDGTALLSPNFVEKEGKNLKNDVDENGVYFIQEMIYLSNKYGEGFVKYMYRKNVSSKKYTKISYVKKFGAWNVFIGTGVYTDNIELVLKKDKELLHRHLYIQIFLMFVTFLSLFLIITTILRKKILEPILRLKNYINKLGNGELPKKFTIKTNNEIQDMAESINILTDNLRNTREFAKEVGEGNFKTSINVFGNKGDLGGALVTMRESLYKIAKEKEKQNYTEKNRNWSIRGLAQFGDILRENNENLEELAYQVISNMVKHLDANQGGFFIINENDKENVFIELLSSFAYNRRKKINKQMKLNEGLVGICIAENETTYLNNIPNEYITVTSGLGNANPKNLLIVPLEINKIIFGAIEIASFKKFESYQIEFVEKVSENIASTISNVQINLRTTSLLKETEEKTKEMKAQEMKMQVTLEELQKAKQKAKQKEDNLMQILLKTREKEMKYKKKLQYFEKQENKK